MKKLTVQYWFGLVIGFGLGVLAAALLLEENVVASVSGVSLLKAIGLLVASVTGVVYGVWRRDLAPTPRPQFSLKTLLWLMAAVAVGFGIYKATH